MKIKPGLCGCKARVLNLPFQYYFRHEIEQEERGGLRETRASHDRNQQYEGPKLLTVSMCKAEPGSHPQCQRFLPLGMLTWDCFSAFAAEVMMPAPLAEDAVYFFSFSSILFTWSSPSGPLPVPQTCQAPVGLWDLLVMDQGSWPP